MSSAMHHVLTDVAAMLALLAPAAWAESGTVEFRGAIEVPTCTVRPDAPTESPAATALRTCPSKAGSKAVGYFTETRMPVAAAGTDPLLDYFARTYKPTAENAGNDMVMRVYL